MSRDELQLLGVDDRMIRREVAAGRWRVHGRQTVAVHTGPLSEEAHRWRAVWETGSRIAALDGVTALQAAGMTGFEVFQQARALHPGMAVVLVTGHGTPEIINEANRLGFNAILLKPFTSDELRGTVEKVLADHA